MPCVATGPAGEAKQGRLAAGGGIAAKDMGIFTSQLGTMLNAGLSITKTLDIQSQTAEQQEAAHDHGRPQEEGRVRPSPVECHGQLPWRLQHPVHRHGPLGRGVGQPGQQPAQDGHLPRARGGAQAQDQERDQLPDDRHHRQRCHRHRPVHLRPAAVRRLPDGPERAPALADAHDAGDERLPGAPLVRPPRRRRRSSSSVPAHGSARPRASTGRTAPLSRRRSSARWCSRPPWHASPTRWRPCSAPASR